MKTTLTLMTLAAASILAVPQFSTADPVEGSAASSQQRGIIVVNGDVAARYDVWINGERAEKQELAIYEGTVWTEGGAIHVRGRPVRASGFVLAVDALDDFPSPRESVGKVNVQDLSRALHGGPGVLAIVVGSNASTGGDDRPVESLSFEGGSVHFRDHVAAVDYFLRSSSDASFLGAGIAGGEGGSLRMTEAVTARGDRFAHSLFAALSGEGQSAGILVLTGPHALESGLVLSSGSVYSVSTREMTLLSIETAGSPNDATRLAQVRSFQR